MCFYITIITWVDLDQLYEKYSIMAQSEIETDFESFEGKWFIIKNKHINLKY